MTDRRTHNDSIYRVSIALSLGKSVVTGLMLHALWFVVTHVPLADTASILCIYSCYEARDDGNLGWQSHQLDHRQTVCTSLSTDNHTNTSSLNFYRPDALTGQIA